MWHSVAFLSRAFSLWRELKVEVIKTTSSFSPPPAFPIRTCFLFQGLASLQPGLRLFFLSTGFLLRFGCDREVSSETVFLLAEVSLLSLEEQEAAP